MNYIRDHYGYPRPKNDGFFERLLGRDKIYPKKPIWIPERQDGEAAFKAYVEQYKRDPANTPGVRISPDGRVQIVGIEGVFAINGILAHMIWEKNKDTHEFYVEESFPLNWMYPYLEPFGLCMRINKEPLADISPEVIRKDRDYWDRYTDRLLGDPKFQRDEVAKKAFSKLRVSIAGVYYWRAINPGTSPDKRTLYFKEADHAFRQSLELCPFSTESAFRYCEMLIRLERFRDALQVLQDLKKEDPHNDKIDDYIVNVQRQADLQRAQVIHEDLVRREPTNFTARLQLLNIYFNRGPSHFEALDKTAFGMIKTPETPPQVLYQLAQMYLNLKRFDRAHEALYAMSRKEPNNAEVWYNIAVLHCMRGEGPKAIKALETAVKAGGDPIKQRARQDPNFSGIRAEMKF